VKATGIVRAVALGTLLAAGSAAAEIVLYSQENFHGKSFSATRSYGDLTTHGFNDRASSAIVYGQRWEVCQHAAYGGRCTILRPGRYPSLAAMGMGDLVSSVRAVTKHAHVEEKHYAPPAYPVYDARRRQDERLYQADVVSVRAVYGRPEQRCWVEREKVADRGNEVGGAVLGGILGGVLGHQIGSGRGNDLATGVGVVAGAAVGANVASEHGGGAVYTQDVRKCANVPGSGKPEYYDVVYHFRKKEHRIQTAAPPGPTITVNSRGEPRA
jgi:uncharacterized protein YcfJ